jgi:hypothetical protein
MMLLGCLLGEGAHALAAAIMGAGTAVTARHFVRAAAHMMQYLPPLLGVEHAPHSHLKVGGGGGHVGWLCVGCTLVIFVLCSAKSNN